MRLALQRAHVDSEMQHRWCGWLCNRHVIFVKDNNVTGLVRQQKDKVMMRKITYGTWRAEIVHKYTMRGNLAS